jgi:hypothetical protein
MSAAASETLPTRDLAKVLKGKFITEEVTLRVSMAEIINTADHLLPIAG